MKKNLKITETDWNKIEVTEIEHTNAKDSEIVFVTCTTREDASRISAKAHNLSNSNSREEPRIIMYVDPHANKCFNAIQNIARTIRQKSENTIQTTVRNGKFDFLLRQKRKGDQTPWSQIPPLRLDHKLPDIEIGMYKNIYTPKEDDIPENDSTLKTMKGMPRENSPPLIHPTVLHLTNPRENHSSNLLEATGRRTLSLMLATHLTH